MNYLYPEHATAFFKSLSAVSFFFFQAFFVYSFFLFIIKINDFYVYEYFAHVYVCDPCLYLVPMSEEVVQSRGTWLMDGGKP